MKKLVLLLLLSNVCYAHNLKVKALREGSRVDTNAVMKSQHFVRLINDNDHPVTYQYEFTNVPQDRPPTSMKKTVTVAAHSRFEDRRTLQTLHKYRKVGQYKFCAYTDTFGEGQAHVADCTTVTIAP